MSSFFRVNTNPFFIYITVVLLGIVAHYGGIEWLEEFYGALDVAAAVALAVFCHVGLHGV